MLNLSLSDFRARYTPLVVAAVDTAFQRLDRGLSSRMKRSRLLKSHGTYPNQLVFNVYDRYQNATLESKYLNYCFGIRRLRPWGMTTDIQEMELPQWGSTPHDAYLHLWIADRALVVDADQFRSYLSRELPRACPTGFTYKYAASDGAQQIYFLFPLQEKAGEFVSQLAELYEQLISAAHPVLLPMIEACREPLTKEERRELLAGRQLPARERSGSRSANDYGRFCPRSWRPEILEKFGGYCQHCKLSLTIETAQMDHIIPWTKDPLRRKENFQPLCSTCNARKGNRENMI
jgi:hypothetical protein